MTSTMQAMRCPARERMLSHMTIGKTITAAAFLAFVASSPLFAATSPTTIHVSLNGEGGSAMTIKLDQSTVKAGKIVFDVTNEAMSEDHELVLIKLKDEKQTLPLLKDKHRVDERKLKSLGEVADLKPGDHGTLTAMLKPGAYELMCNVKGHYEAGMHTVLTVTK
jgi:uncharacterized cupredoxin-like copper-binding protein